MKLNLNSKVPFDEHALSDGRKLIRFKISGSDYAPEEANRNVFLVDTSGHEIWRIGYHKNPHGNDPFHGADPFVGFHDGADGTVIGLTWDGWKFEINLFDGSIKEVGWTKS